MLYKEIMLSAESRKKNTTPLDRAIDCAALAELLLIRLSRAVGRQ